jgi:hypothetical protein
MSRHTPSEIASYDELVDIDVVREHPFDTDVEPALGLRTSIIIDDVDAVEAPDLTRHPWGYVTT